MIPLASATDSERKGLSKVFRQRQSQLVTILFDAIRDESSASWKQPLSFDEVQTWGKSQLSTTLDLLSQRLETGDPLFQELFEGWVRFQMVSDLSIEKIPEDYQPDQVIRLARSRWTEILRPDCSSRAIEVFEQDLEASISSLAKKPLKNLSVLFIGDCIQFEILSALLGPCSQSQIQITTELLNEKVQPLLRNRIRALSSQRFDLVFFSPFSHTYLPEYEILLKPKSLFWSGEDTSPSRSDDSRNLVDSRDLGCHLRLQDLRPQHGRRNSILWHVVGSGKKRPLMEQNAAHSANDQ